MADFNITGTNRPTPINKRPQSNNFFDFLEYPEIDRQPNLNPKLSTPATDQPIQSLALLKNSATVVPSTPPLAQPTSMPTMTPSPMGLPMPPPQPEQDDSSNFLGSLIAQGVAGIGTGLMGGSASDIQRSAGMFDSMRSQQASRDRAKLLMDPKSEESKKRRMVFEKALNFKIPDNFSYTDLNDPTVLQGLKGQAEQSRLLTMPRQGGGVGRVSGVGKPEKEKKNPFQDKINTIKTYADNGLQALDKLEKIIKEKGTAELTGSEELKINQYVNDIAIAKTKILDPTSQVLPGEVDTIKGLLGVGGFNKYFTSDKTAIEGLQNFRELLNNNKNNALKNLYGLPANDDFSEKENFIIEKYKENRDDPDTIRAYQNMLKSKGLNNA